MSGFISIVGAYFMGYILSKMVMVLSDVWGRFKGYDSMKNRGYILMTSEDGEEFWVGYGD